MPTTAHATVMNAPPPLFERHSKTSNWHVGEMAWIDRMLTEYSEELVAIPMHLGRGKGAVREIAKKMLKKYPQELEGPMRDETAEQYKKRYDSRSDVRESRAITNFTDQICRNWCGCCITIAATRPVVKRSRKLYHKPRSMFLVFPARFPPPTEPPPTSPASSVFPSRVYGRTPQSGR